jgi:hypothetical protein
MAVGQIVLVLYADDVRDGTALIDLLRSHITQTDMLNQTLALQLCKRGKRRLDRTLRGPVHVEHEAQVDDVEHVHAQIAKVVMHRAGQVLRREGRPP